jgi:hypothetical protein
VGIYYIKKEEYQNISIDVLWKERFSPYIIATLHGG